MTELQMIGHCIERAWEDDHPPELDPMWRKRYLVMLISERLLSADAVREFVAACGELE